MQKVSFVVAGRSVLLGKDDVEAAVRDVSAEPIRLHFTVVNGRRFPPKQVIALATGIDRSDFTTIQARSILRKLGFASSRASPASTMAGESTVPYRSSEADELRPYIGKWVGYKDSRVVASAETPEELLSLLRAGGIKGAAVFGVPVVPEEDIGALD